MNAKYRKIRVAALPLAGLAGIVALTVAIVSNHYDREITASQYSEIASIAQGNCRAEAALKAHIEAGPIMLLDYAALAANLRQIKEQSEVARIRAGILKMPRPSPCTS